MENTMHKIYFFSGTGNTLYLAKNFASLFPDVVLCNISHLERDEEIVLDSDITGIFFPVYCGGIPRILSRFLARVKAPEGGQGKRVLYAVASSGGVPGGALPIVEDTLAEKGLNLTSAFHIRMPSNYYPLSGPPSSQKQQKLFSDARRALRVAAIMVKKGKRTRPLRVFPIDTFIKFIAERAVATLAASDKAFHVDKEKCNTCELCLRLCPAANITFTRESTPAWSNECEQCMGCLQWCPNGAIRYGNVKESRERYHHPEISAMELARKDFE